jgi:replicative DNA helicase
VSNVRQLPPHNNAADDDGLNRTPPGDPEAERALLARCIHHPEEYTAAAEIVGSEDFTHPGHRILWDVIGHQLAEHKPVDPISLRAAIEKLGQLRAVSRRHLIWEVVQRRSAPPTPSTTPTRPRQDPSAPHRRPGRTPALRRPQRRHRRGPRRTDHRLVQERTTSPTAGSGRFVPGGSFILDRPDTVPAVWGEGDNILWAEGEALIIAGPPGVGKTTVGQQVLLAAIGVRAHALGMAVRPAKRVLYLASDRPQQAARSMARMVTTSTATSSTSTSPSGPAPRRRTSSRTPASCCACASRPTPTWCASTP